MQAQWSGSNKKIYNQSPAGRWRALKNSARQRNIEVSIIKEVAFKLFVSACHYCGRVPDEKRLNGIDRIDSEGPYEERNIVSSCHKCNKVKSDMTVVEFLALATAVHSYQTEGVPRATNHGRAKPDTIERKVATYHRNATLRGLAFELQVDEVRELLEGACAYCGVPEANGIDRADSDRDYCASNCVSACFHCNGAKWDIPAEEFISLMSRVCENGQAIIGH